MKTLIFATMLGFSAGSAVYACCEMPVTDAQEYQIKNLEGVYQQYPNTPDYYVVVTKIGTNRYARYSDCRPAKSASQSSQATIIACLEKLSDTMTLGSDGQSVLDRRFATINVQIDPSNANSLTSKGGIGFGGPAQRLPSLSLENVVIVNREMTK